MNRVHEKNQEYIRNNSNKTTIIHSFASNDKLHIYLGATILNGASVGIVYLFEGTQYRKTHIFPPTNFNKDHVVLTGGHILNNDIYVVGYVCDKQKFMSNGLVLSFDLDLNVKSINVIDPNKKLQLNSIYVYPNDRIVVSGIIGDSGETLSFVHVYTEDLQETLYCITLPEYMEIRDVIGDAAKNVIAVGFLRGENNRKKCCIMKFSPELEDLGSHARGRGEYVKVVQVGKDFHCMTYDDKWYVFTNELNFKEERNVVQRQPARPKKPMVQ